MVEIEIEKVEFYFVMYMLKSLFMIKVKLDDYIVKMV